tara:strand:- start:274 stop:489 length:216 start_codon:yes stop_codon:yes gene_type:complete
VGDDLDILDRYEKLTNDIDEIYQKSEDLLGNYTYDDERDTFIDPWSKLEDVLGVDILLQVAKINREVQNQN